MMKKIVYYAAFGIPILLVGFGALLAPSTGSGEESQKEYIKFSHAKHVTEQGLECETCHASAAQSLVATDKLIGGHESCESCHSDEVANTCDFCHSGDPEAIPPTAFDRQLSFNHKLHIEDQKVECVRCHSTIAKDETGVVDNFPVMETCTSCHNQSTATNECESCHLNLQTLWPSSHAQTGFKREHGRFVQTGSPDANCQSCHSDASCAQCHDGTNLTMLSKGVATGTIAPRILGNDKARPTAKENVHDANYLYTHGIDAKAKLYDCQTCHDSKTFCNDCHSGGTELFGTVRPSSHNKAGFTLAGGYGSGGGTHATLARRDIQQCQSCHNIDGGDFSCVKCHIDPDGIKRTNPKTHEIDFMRNVNGDWHTNGAANCFVCHTDPNARPNGNAGTGFCGYCHGAAN